MKTINYKTVQFSVLCFLFSVLSTAQNYEWQWAKHGGGSAQVTNENGGSYSNDNFEHIRDIVTDEDNNYYFLGRIASGSTHVDGNPIPDYGIGSSGNNIIITSFTCGGVYRWSRVIGGGQSGL